VRLVWAAGNFSIALVWLAQGRQEEVVSGYWGVVELRWKELEGGGLWAANRACELAVPARQPGNGDCVLLARREEGVLRLKQHGEAVTVVIQSSAGRGMARTVSDVRRRGRPMVRGGAAGQRVRAWRVAPTRTHPRRE
jgi:hypothetical protein